METPNTADRLGENSIEPQDDESVPVELVSPSAAAFGQAQKTEEVAPFAVEFCSGTAGLTVQLRHFGLRQSLGIDHVVKAGAKAPVCKLDLTDIPCASMLTSVSPVELVPEHVKYHWGQMRLVRFVVKANLRDLTI